ncbi:MAG: hypothetical protein ACPG6R_10845 [Aequoribacter sp.]|uniref:hypothetical protein n=1 Tax=Aequoribacter sp. TaxID=2847771 RepID=UPI003C48B7D5
MKVEIVTCDVGASFCAAVIVSVDDETEVWSSPEVCVSERHAIEEAEQAATLRGWEVVS